MDPPVISSTLRSRLEYKTIYNKKKSRPCSTLLSPTPPTPTPPASPQPGNVLSPATCDRLKPIIIESVADVNNESILFPPPSLNLTSPF